MEMIAHCRAMAAFCRQHARFENEEVMFWQSEAKAWDDLVIEHTSMPGRSRNECAHMIFDPPASDDPSSSPSI
jgi:hypothetical protein